MSDSNEAVLSALRQSWEAGYKAAVSSLREIANEFGNDTVSRVFIEELAKSVEKLKPPPG